MRMTRVELNKILELHRKWLDNAPEGGRLSLSNANLYGVDLHDAKLRGADLYGANLSNVDLHGADLHDADLRFANLRFANLRFANLSSANLYDANLRGANLSSANLSSANLSSANLCGANLSSADLGWVNWHEAEGLKVYEAQLNSSRENAQLVYIPSLDIATTGFWQGSWKDTKERVDRVYKNADTSIYKKCQLAFKYIEEQMEAEHDTRTD